MRSLFLYLILLAVVIKADAQTLKGFVTDGATGKPLYFATVTDINSRQSSSTSEAGSFAIPAKKEDAISFTYVGYTPVQRLAEPGTEMHVELFPLSIQLKDFILHPGYTPFQKDSIEMAALYSKELNKQRIKPKVGLNNGLAVDGLIGSAVQKMSRSYKQNKKFQENFKKDEEQKYIDTRYRPELVTAVTGFTGDTVAVFINAYPMEYDFSRAATDLELRMWIRDNYKEYLRKRLHPPTRHLSH